GSHLGRTVGHQGGEIAERLLLEEIEELRGNRSCHEHPPTRKLCAILSEPAPMKSPETYYRDHWVTIEPERLDAYEQMFRWRPEMDALIAPAEIAPGQSVLDFGCGPGWLAIELARRVGPSGHVHALDVNQAFLQRAAAHVAAENLRERVSFQHVAGERIPLDDGTLDRVVTKNVLEYVPDLGATLVEMRRVLKPSGR